MRSMKVAWVLCGLAQSLVWGCKDDEGTSPPPVESAGVAGASLHAGGAPGVLGGAGGVQGRSGAPPATAEGGAAGTDPTNGGAPATAGSPAATAGSSGDGGEAGTAAQFDDAMCGDYCAQQVETGCPLDYCDEQCIERANPQVDCHVEWSAYVLCAHTLESDAFVCGGMDNVPASDSPCLDEGCEHGCCLIGLGMPSDGYEECGC